MHSLSIAKGSIIKVTTQLGLDSRFKCISLETYQSIVWEICEIDRMIMSLRLKLK